MSNSHAPPEPKRQQRRRARAQKKQARKNLKRREKILAGLVDPFMAALIERAGLISERREVVPLDLVPTRKLRQRVEDLNFECCLLTAGSPPSSPEHEEGPDKYVPTGHELSGPRG